MKIINKDNYDRETHSDTLVATGLNEHYAKRIVDLLNKEEGPDSSSFFKAVPDDYKLYEWEP
jgi:hypothetical protein